MHLWGYKYDEKKKGVYYDGYERPDVVKYRKEWLKRMFEYKKSMKDFDSNMLDVVLEPQLKPEEKELVQVTHDECHFYANDRQRKIWMQKDENILRSKHIGRSIMVLTFLCPLYMQPKLFWAAVIISKIPNSIMASQIILALYILVHQAIPIFEILHPGCIGVFCFDQSTNHNAMAGDALVATKMNLSPRGKQPKMRDGWYIKDGEKCVQSMTFPNNHHLKGQPKVGLRSVQFSTVFAKTKTDR
ncbi:unnamed protein product [Rhizophagus irregularis]|nr:unnamed protein product [Rhizophagus irregularis]